MPLTDTLIRATKPGEKPKKLADAGGLYLLVSPKGDLHDRPAHGYDFLSFSARQTRRYIEVKSVAKVGRGYRFFLSANEHRVSKLASYSDEYYFYLVQFNKFCVPVGLKAVKAGRIYEVAELTPASYEVIFELDW